MNRTQVLVTPEQKLQWLESGNGENGRLRVEKLQLYKRYLRLPEEEKKRIQAAYISYYDLCVKSEAAINFFEMRGAMSRGNLGEIRERAAWAKDDRMEPVIPKPKEFPVDPDSFGYDPDILSYRSALNDLKIATQTADRTDF